MRRIKICLRKIRSLRCHFTQNWVFLHTLFLENEAQINGNSYGTMLFMSKQVSLPKISLIVQKMKIDQKLIYALFARGPSIITQASIENPRLKNGNRLFFLLQITLWHHLHMQKVWVYTMSAQGILLIINAFHWLAVYKLQWFNLDSSFHIKTTTTTTLLVLS